MPDGDELVGVWRLVDCYLEYQHSPTREPYFGAAAPSGYVVFTPGRRMMALLVGGDRTPGHTGEMHAALFRTMVAYTGRYRVAGNEFITSVDASWNGEWTGTEQARCFTLSGRRLEITTPWMPHPVDPERRMTRGVLIWERVE